MRGSSYAIIPLSTQNGKSDKMEMEVGRTTYLPIQIEGLLIQNCELDEMDMDWMRIRSGVDQLPHLHRPFSRLLCHRLIPSPVAQSGDDGSSQWIVELLKQQPSTKRIMETKGRHRDNRILECLQRLFLTDFVCLRACNDLIEGAFTLNECSCDSGPLSTTMRSLLVYTQVLL